MNVNASILARVTEAAQTNKKPCKLYKTEAAADKATAAAAQNVANYFSRTFFIATQGRAPDSVENSRSARYVVVYIPCLDRWVGAIDLQEVMGRADSMGGYLGIEPGFYKY